MSERISLQDKLDFIEQLALRHRSWECLIWPYKLNDGGYPFIDHKLRAHQYLCTRVHGPPPTRRHEVAHTCGVRSCVNPLHVQWKTRQANQADRLLHGTHQHGELNPSAKLSNEQAATIRQRNGESPFLLAKEYGVSPQSIRNIQRGKTFGSPLAIGPKRL